MPTKPLAPSAASSSSAGAVPVKSTRVAKPAKPKLAATSGRGSQGTQQRANHRTADGEPVPKYTSLTPLVLESFLHVMALSGNFSKACRELRLNPTTVFALRHSDEEFGKRYNDAMRVAAEGWEAEVARRAFEGYERPVYQQGMLVGQQREFSDSLAAMLLKGAKPERYRERSSSEVTLRGGVTVALEQLTDAELDELLNKKLLDLGARHPQRYSVEAQSDAPAASKP